jgi:predicted aldo/keto reductase-like oxidoreductase
MNPNQPTSRRRFLQTSLAVPAALSVLGGTAATSTAADTDFPLLAGALPTRKLGRNGPEVTILNIGGMMSAHSPQYLDIAWKMGIRYFDTAKVYINGQSEQHVAGWLKRYPERRKELFLVSKEPAGKGPEQMLASIDERLEACGTEYLDLFFLHGIGPRKHGAESLNWPKSNRFKKVCEKLKSSGKCRMVGFSCHDARLVDYLNAAAEGGFVDAIMLKNNPLLTPGDEFDRALDACHQAGIGLISMKEMKPFANAPKINPGLEKLGLTTHQALLHAVWSDPRFSSICSSMENVEQIKENAGAARLFKDPLPPEGRKALQEVASLIRVPMCPGCPSCNAYAKAGGYAFCDIARYVCYYEQDGNPEARSAYHRLAAAERDRTTRDLAALRDGCQYRVDYPEIAARAERYFA